MPEPSFARRRGGSCGNCGGTLCDGRACYLEMDRWYASHEPRHVEPGECPLCGEVLPLSNVCDCETTYTGQPAFASYEGDAF